MSEIKWVSAHERRRKKVGDLFATRVKVSGKIFLRLSFGNSFLDKSGKYCIGFDFDKGIIYAKQDHHGYKMATANKFTTRLHLRIPFTAIGEKAETMEGEYIWKDTKDGVLVFERKAE